MTNEVRVEATDDLVEIHLRGKLTRETYERFVPLLERRIAQHGKLSLLVVLNDFHGWTAGALWEDVKFDVQHFRDIRRLALSGESRWQQGMAAFCKPFTTAEVRYFPAEELERARAWVRGGADAARGGGQKEGAART